MDLGEKKKTCIFIPRYRHAIKFIPLLERDNLGGSVLEIF